MAANRKFRKTGEPIEVLCWNGSPNCRVETTDRMSYIDSEGIEHENELWNYYWDTEAICDSEVDEYDEDDDDLFVKIATIASMMGRRSSGDTRPPSEIAKLAIADAKALEKHLENELYGSGD